jgi:5-hydroxyisourate hydrolase
MSTLTIHVLDTSLGHPAAGVPARLEHLTGGEPAPIAEASTDHHGRGRHSRPQVLRPPCSRLSRGLD